MFFLGGLHGTTDTLELLGTLCTHFLKRQLIQTTMKASSQLTPGTLARLLALDPPDSGEDGVGNHAHSTLSYPASGLREELVNR